MPAPTKVSHVGKQPTGLDKGSGIGLKDFHGDPNHARVTQNVTQLQNRYLWCPVVLNDRTPSGKQPWLRQRELGLDRVSQSMRDDVIRNLSGAGGVMMSAQTYSGLPQYPCLKQRRVKPNITHCQWNEVLRNRKHVPCFYPFIVTRVEVWENEKCCGNTSRWRVFPQLFRVLPNFEIPRVIL